MSSSDSRLRLNMKTSLIKYSLTNQSFLQETVIIYWNEIQLLKDLNISCYNSMNVDMT